MRLAEDGSSGSGLEQVALGPGVCWEGWCCLYGVVSTLQPAHFGRVYAAYGGFFIVLSLVWGWIFDGNRPDRFDVIGATVSLVGVFIIMYWPR